MIAIPTGDATCPEYIKIDKRAERKRLEQANVMEIDDAGEPIMSAEDLQMRSELAMEAIQEPDDLPMYYSDPDEGS